MAKVIYQSGRARMAAPPPARKDEQQPTNGTDNAHLLHIENRLSGIEDNTFDLADRVHVLGRMVAIALVTLICCIGVLIAAALLVRNS